jgi:ribosomal protein L11
MLLTIFYCDGIFGVTGVAVRVALAAAAAAASSPPVGPVIGAAAVAAAAVGIVAAPASWNAVRDDFSVAVVAL